MKRELIHILIVTSVLLTGGTDVFALCERDFNYCPGDKISWGTGLLENYDVAIKLSGNGLTGSSIEEVKIPLEGLEDLSNINLWCSSVLKLDGKTNVADIFSYPAEIIDGNAVVKLSAPVKIPSEGLFIGCSFSVDKLSDSSKAPLTVSKGGNSDSFYIHTSRKYSKWGNFDLDISLDMAVTLLGDFYDQSLEVTACKEGNVIAGSLWQPEIEIRNIGLSPCHQFTYTLSIDDILEAEGTVDLPDALNPDFTHYSLIKLNELEAPASGTYNWKVSIESVDNLKNNNDIDSADGELYVWIKGYEHRPLMEEYTGTWCGWCPRGAVGLAKMTEKYGDEFVSMAYHTDPSKDPMATALVPTTKYPGAPWGVLDRSVNADPFYGHLDFTLYFEEGIDAAWNEVRQSPSPADLKGIAVWMDKTKEAVGISGTVTFAREYHNKDVRIGYFLVSDGLSSREADWMQSNYYSGLEQYNGGDLEALYNSPKHMADAVYDHVLIYSPDVLGTSGSLDDNIMAGKVYDFFETISLEKAVNAGGMSLVQDKEKLKVVIAVIEADSNIVLNCRIMTISDSEAGDIVSESTHQLISTCYYDYLGIKHSQRPERGVQVDRFDDGSVVVTKF